MLIAGSYIPLLLLPIPLSLSPVHFTVLLGMTYMLNRPCLYCSLLLIILFATSCHWSKTCLIDFSYVPVSEGGSGHATWFLPRIETVNEGRFNSTNETLSYMASALVNTTIAGLAETATRIKGRAMFLSASPGYITSTISTIKELFRKEWVLPCIKTRLAL